METGRKKHLEARGASDPKEEEASEEEEAPVQESAELRLLR